MAFLQYKRPFATIINVLSNLKIIYILYVDETVIENTTPVLLAACVAGVA
jgi:hypothetical protein